MPEPTMLQSGQMPAPGHVGIGLWQRGHRARTALGPYVAEASLERRGSVAGSKRRLEFLREQSASIRQVADIKRVLADQSVPICKTPTRERNNTTFDSVVFEMTPSPRAHFCPGLPTSKPWEQLGWNSAAHEGTVG
jgi:hypothetical protein